MSGWKDALTPDEASSVEVYDKVITEAARQASTARKNRRALYLRAMQRIHRNNQKSVDSGMDQA